MDFLLVLRVSCEQGEREVKIFLFGEGTASGVPQIFAGVPRIFAFQGLAWPVRKSEPVRFTDCRDQADSGNPYIICFRAYGDTGYSCP